MSGEEENHKCDARYKVGLRIVGVVSVDGIVWICCEWEYRRCGARYKVVEVLWWVALSGFVVKGNIANVAQGMN